MWYFYKIDYNQIIKDIIVQKKILSIANKA